MQDVSRITGNPIVIDSKVKGRTFILRGMTFEDVGAVQAEMLKRKRAAKTETATSMVKQLGNDYPLEERRRILDNARNEVDQIAFVSDEEFDVFLGTLDGGLFMLWAMMERQYPGACSRQDIAEMVGAGEFGAFEAAIGGLVGGGPAGNSTGQGSAADHQPPATPTT